MLRAFKDACDRGSGCRSADDIMTGSKAALRGGKDMEAALLMFDVIGVILVLLWVARGRGDAGLPAWRADPEAKHIQRRG